MTRWFSVLFLCCFLLHTPVNAAENEKLVALTFDDGPSGRFTRRLLAELEARDAKATFLLCGYRIEQYPDLTKQIFQQGHEIGLHGYSHKSMQNMCRQEAVQEIKKTLALLPSGCDVSFLRPPGGLYNPCVKSVAEEFGLSILHWSLDPKDWATGNIKAIESAVVNHIQDGDVILLHDMSDSSVDAALRIVDELQKQGFRLVTASELAQAKSIPLVPGVKYTHFRLTVPSENK